MAYALIGPSGAPQPAAVVILHRALHMSRSTGAFLERWLRETNDPEIFAGLSLQLADERRHFRLLTNEMKRLTGAPASPGPDLISDRPFLEAADAKSDLNRICIIHHGVKAFTLDRYSHLIPIVDRPLALVLDQTARDLERHVRWADIRLARHSSEDQRRQHRLLIERIHHMLEVSWSKEWTRLTHTYGTG